MDIVDAKILKEKLRLDIQDLVDTYMKETDLVVEVDSHTMHILGRKPETRIEVKICM